MENSEAKNKNYIAYAKAVSFLSLEIIAFVAFDLGHSFLFYSILGIVLCALLFIVLKKKFIVDELIDLTFFLFPIIIFGLLSTISNFTYSNYFVLNGWQKYFIPIAFVAFSTCGYLLTKLDSFNIKHALFVIYASLAIFSLINLLTIFVEFEPFYTLSYSGKYIYFDGSPSKVDVASMAYCLIGFDIVEVPLNYFSLFPTLLLTSFIVLFFVKYKDNKKLYLSYLLFGLIGLISLVLTINKINALVDVLMVTIIAIIILCAKFKFSKKPLKIAAIIAFIVLFLGFVLMILNNLEYSGLLSLQNAIKGNSFLNRLFNSNRFVSRFNPILKEIFNGLLFGGVPGIYSLSSDAAVGPTGSWLFDTIMTSGIIGLVLFVVYLYFAFKFAIRYFALYDKDEKEYKALLLSFVVVFFTYTFINFDTSILIFEIAYSPLYLEGVFLISLLLFAYCYGRVKSIKVTKHESEEKVDE